MSLRVGIIGTQWGCMHIGAFRHHGATISAIAGLDPEETTAVATAQGIPVATTDVSALCEASDLVVVASPDGTHAALAKTALEAGCHVLCEQPLSRTTDNARALAAASRAHPEQIAAVCFPYRALPAMQVLRRHLQTLPTEWVTVDLRSSVADIEGRSPKGPRMGVSGDFGGVSHVVDALSWLTETQPEWVQAQMQGRPAHSVALHAGDRVMTWSINHYASHEPGLHGVWRFVSEAEEIRLLASRLPGGAWQVGAAERMTDGAWSALVPPESDPHPWRTAMETTAGWMLAAIRGDDRGALATFDDGARVQELLNGAMRSAVRGSRITLGR